MAVTSLSAADLARSDVVNTTSLSLAVPGLMFMQGANTATPFIRGVGSATNSVGAEGAVSTYIDGVYVTSLNATLFELNNVERVEVLKGPQGTLFGRNATGGVVQIITKDPSSTPAVDLHIRYGNFDTTSGSFYGTTGVGDNVAVDLAAYGRNQADGWGTALVTGRPTFTRHDFGGRSKLLLGFRARTRGSFFAADFNRARNEDGLGSHIAPSAIGSDEVSGYQGFYNTYDNPNDFSDVRQTGVSVTAEQAFQASRLVQHHRLAQRERIHAIRSGLDATRNRARTDLSTTDRSRGSCSCSRRTKPQCPGSWYVSTTSTISPRTTRWELRAGRRPRSMSAKSAVRRNRSRTPRFAQLMRASTSRHARDDRRALYRG